MKNLFRANFIHYDGDRDGTNGKIVSYYTNIKDNDHSFLIKYLLNIYYVYSSTLGPGENQDSVCCKKNQSTCKDTLG